MSTRGSSFTAFVGLVIALSGCSLPSGEGSEDVHVAVTDSVRQKMVGGTTSHTGQDATVMLVEGGQQACTGTLIAPNLVLTARHCVAEPSGNEECGTYGTQRQASSITVTIGVNARPTDIPAARGAQIFVPATSNMCSFDVALIQLDRDVVGAPIAPVRFTPLAPNEPVTAVGYGVDGQDRSPIQRQQRQTTVLGVGPQAIQYTTKQNEPINYNIPQGDVATGESTCYGDSGGPLFDAQGRLVAVTSRGVPDFPQTSAHGNGCIDLPSVYAGVLFNEQTIRQAAQTAGHPLPASTAQNQGDIGPQDSEETGELGISGDDEDAVDEEPKPKKKKKARAMVPSSSGCTTARGHVPSGSLAIAGIALAVACVRRRRR